MADKEKYIKGFNHGYCLKMHNPELLNIILPSKSDNDYFKGLDDGSKILAKDRTQLRLQELRKNRGDKNIELDI